MNAAAQQLPLANPAFSPRVAPAARSARPGALPPEPLTVRLPTQAGKVSAVLSGKFVPEAANSWIAKGDKRFSLCTPTKDNKVACSPIVATATMQDIEITAGNAPDGTGLVVFTPSKASKRGAANLHRAMQRFMGRVTKASAHLSRQAVSYAPKPWETSARVGGRASASAGGGGACNYDDFGSYSCTGGSSGGGTSSRTMSLTIFDGTEGGGGGGYDGGGSEGDIYDGGEWGGCYGACEYPAGNDNGDPEPGTNQNGDIPVVEIPGQRPDPEPNVPVVIVTGERPYPQRDPNVPIVVITGQRSDPIEIIPAALPTGCFPGPRGMRICQPTPPIIPAPTEIPKPSEIPSLGGGQVWSGIDWCALIGYGCPKASEDDNARAEEALRRAEKVHQCLAEAAALKEYCVGMSKHTLYPTENAIACVEGAVKQLQECLALAKGEQP